MFYSVVNNIYNYTMKSKNKSIIVVGSGLFGSVIAHQASLHGIHVSVIESRNHIGGNCYTEDDPETGINVHKYGPHIFHTSNTEIWNYINQFTGFNQYKHKCLSSVNGKMYSMPINLATINAINDSSFIPTSAKFWLESQKIKNDNPSNFEEQALALVGEKLYKSFIYGYTKKHWGCEPTNLPSSYAKRLPVRTNYNDRYYNDIYEGIPLNGYTPIFEKMLNHPNIEVVLNTDWFDVRNEKDERLVVYSGAIDRLYDYCHGRLGWRTLDFEFSVLGVDDFQGVTQVNYPSLNVPYTRIIEHKHFHPEKNYHSGKTIIGIEFSREAKDDDTPYYPINSEEDRKKYKLYKKMVDEEKNMIVGGRLGEYMYYDMHQVIGSALSIWRNKIKHKMELV